MEELYRVVIKESKKSSNIIFENINHSEMLSYYDKYENAFQLKIYNSTDGGFWSIESIFENGEMVQFKDVVKDKSQKTTTESYGMGEDFSMAEFFERISAASPLRKENPISLLRDIIQGEDISKPKLKIVENKTN